MSSREALHTATHTLGPRQRGDMISILLQDHGAQLLRDFAGDMDNIVWQRFLIKSDGGIHASASILTSLE